MAARKSSSRKTSRSASKDVGSAMRRRKKGTLKRGKAGRGGKVTSRKQAIAIGLSEARAKGKKVAKKSARKSSATKPPARKKTARKKTATTKRATKSARKRSTSKRASTRKRSR